MRRIRKGAWNSIWRPVIVTGESSCRHRQVFCGWPGKPDGTGRCSANVWKRHRRFWKRKGILSVCWSWVSMPPQLARCLTGRRWPWKHWWHWGDIRRQGSFTTTPWTCISGSRGCGLRPGWWSCSTVWESRWSTVMPGWTISRRSSPRRTARVMAGISAPIPYSRVFTGWSGGWWNAEASRYIWCCAWWWMAREIRWRRGISWMSWRRSLVRLCCVPWGGAMPWAGMGTVSTWYSWWIPPWRAAPLSRNGSAQVSFPEGGAWGCNIT